MRSSKYVAVVLATLGVGLWSPAADQPQKKEKLRGNNEWVKLEQLPDSYKEIAKKAFPKAEWQQVQLNKDLGDHESLWVYEIAGMSEGVAVEVDVRKDGTIEEIEIEVPKVEAPDRALQTLRSEYPDFQVEKVERSIRYYRSGEKATWYEFKGTTQMGAKIDVEVTEDGKYFVVEAY